MAGRGLRVILEAGLRGSQWCVRGSVSLAWQVRHRNRRRGGGGGGAKGAPAPEGAGGVEERGEKQQTDSEGRHKNTIHCKTPKSGTHGDGNGNNLSPEPPAPRCSRRCGRPRR